MLNELNDKVTFAKVFASALHADRGQVYDGQPYSVHLQEVVDVLLRFDHIDKSLLAAGYLHDAVEDTGIDLLTVELLFGPKVKNLVSALTDEPGENRKIRKAATYPKIKATEGALIIKLADRIANVEHGIATKNVRMQKMYRKEYDEFSQNLRTLGQLEEMWGHLQSLHLSCT